MLIRATKFEEELLRDLRKAMETTPTTGTDMTSPQIVCHHVSLMLILVPSVGLDEVYDAWKKTRMKVSCVFRARSLQDAGFVSSRRVCR